MNTIVFIGPSSAPKLRGLTWLRLFDIKIVIVILRHHALIGIINIFVGHLSFPVYPSNGLPVPDRSLLHDIPGPVRVLENQNWLENKLVQLLQIFTATLGLVDSHLYEIVADFATHACFLTFELYQRSSSGHGLFFLRPGVIA
jgi:hypothetical protein